MIIVRDKGKLVDNYENHNDFMKGITKESKKLVQYLPIVQLKEKEC